MAIWKLSSGEPVTVERERRVYNTETGEEGYATVVRGVGVRLAGPVCRKECDYNDDGTVRDERYFPIDKHPEFAS